MDNKIVIQEAALKQFNEIKERVRNGAYVKRYGYRKASIYNIVAELPREEARDLEEALAVRVWEKPDNHTTFSVTNHEDGSQLHIVFTDQIARIGKQIHVQDW